MKKNTEKKKGSLGWKITCIVVCVIFIPIIIVNLALNIQALNNTEKLPSIFGVCPLIVESGSMSPEIEYDDLIFIKKVDADTLQAKEDVICFKQDGILVTHRIDEIKTVDGVTTFITKGDANNTIDSEKGITAEQIQGEYIGKLAGMGGVMKFIQSPLGIVLTIFIPLALYFAYEVLLWKKEKQKETERLQNELAELKAAATKDETAVH